MSNKTAMQALVELLKVNDIYKECMPYILDIIDDVYLPMEKEQIMDAYSSGEHQQGYEAEAEQYYNETYNNERKEGDIRQARV